MKRPDQTPLKRARQSRKRWKPKRRFKVQPIKPIRIPRATVPSMFTVMNMVCGYIAIVMASKESFVAAGWFIIGAAVFDTLDGFIARLTKSTSEFGVELDSLSDLVSFGAAPSFLAYKYGLEHFDTFGMILSSLLMVGSGLRLARFNVQLVGFSKDHFSGLPTPSQAMTLSTFVIATSTENFFTAEQTRLILIGLTIGLALIMVSKIKYDVLPKPTPSEFKAHPVKLSLALIALAVILIFQAKGFFCVMMVYIVAGIIRSIYHFFFSEEIAKTPELPVNAASDGDAIT
jgi:CDP-diacylglycerol---serine O-phosphatidyltransferase